MRGKYLATMLGVLLFSATIATAAPFRIYGPTAMAMGGAGVASARGAYAIYYNPAALAVDSRSARIALSASAAVRDVGVAEHLDNLDQYDWDEVTANPVQNWLAALAVVDELLQIDDGDGVMVSAGGTLAAKVLHTASGSYGIGAFVDTQASAYPIIDKTHLRITPPIDPLSLAHNNSTLFLQGMGLVEVPLTYATQIKAGEGSLCIGGSLKYIRAITYDASIDVTDVASDEIVDEIEAYDEISSSVGVDAGVLFQPAGDRLSLGLLVRNINSPEFDTVTGDTFQEDMQIRAGIALACLDGKLVLTADADLTSNETFLYEYESQMLGGGVSFEMTPGIFETALRLGVMKNMAEDDPGLVFTGGLALGLKWFHLNIAGAASSQQGHYAEESWPSEGKLTMALESAW